MGRRSRKRAATAPERTAPAEAAATRPPAGRRRSTEERPPAPWGRFPLSELCTLLALGLGVAGLIVWGRTGVVMLVCAAGLGSLAGLELSLREHLAGYRSHTTLLAGTVAVATLAALFFSEAPRVAMLPGAAAVFAIAFFGLRQLFKRRSGGLGFR